MIKNKIEIFSKATTFIDIIRIRAEQNPDYRALTFLTNNGNLELTYSELDIKIRRLAARLQNMGLEGERALLLYPPGFDYIVGYFACLYSGVIAVPVYPPDPSNLRKTLPRLQAIVKDAKAIVALSTQEILDDVKNINSHDSKLTDSNNMSEQFNLILNLKWLATDNLGNGFEENWKYPNVNSESIAYLQYTSGSTGAPKGVMINHQNLLHNSNMIYHGFGLDNDGYEGVIWLPIYHDMGLIGGILQPIFAGFHFTLLSPIDFLKRPLRWLQIISDIKDKSVVSGGPNFAYDLCLRASNQQKREKLDLCNWKLAFSGAEPVRAETINEFSKAFEVSGFEKKAFYPCFGLAEGTLIVSGGDTNNEPLEISIDKEKLKSNKAVEVTDYNIEKIKFVSSGTSLLDGIIKIVNHETRTICEDNEIGEVWAASQSIAQGYWEKPVVSRETFQAYTSDTNEGPFLRTGDLGFMVEDELFITGRLKDLIIIRGSNHYPQDIEATVENSNNLLRPGGTASFSADVNNEEQLVIVQEARAKQNVNWEDVVEDIKKAVLEIHNILPHTIVLIQPKSIFKTSSGKIKRNATKQAFSEKSLDIIFEWNILEQNNSIKSENIEVELDTSEITKSGSKENLTNLLIEKLALELKVDKSKINTDQPFVNYGLDSAKSVQLVGQLEEDVGRNLDVTILWTYPTIEKLVEHLTGNKSSILDKSEAKDEKDSKEKSIQEINELSDEEVEKLLLEKLKSDDLES